jgi:hypothetical protein
MYGQLRAGRFAHRGGGEKGKEHAMKMMRMIVRQYKSALAASAAIAFLLMATHTAQADQITVGSGGTLTYSVTDGGGTQQCSAGGNILYYYSFTLESYENQAGTQNTNLNDSWGGDWLYTEPAGGCAYNSPPMGAGPASTRIDLTGGAYILFYPGDGGASAQCFLNGGTGC